jgi:feruloyl esterase
MSGSVDAKASHRDLVYRLKRRPRMSRLVMALLSATLLCAVIVRASQATAGQSPPARPTAPEQACGELVSLTFEGNTTITASTTVSTGALVTRTDQSLTGLPAFCRVIGVSRPTSDSDIRFEVWLPADSWNGKFVSSGEGGFAGRLNYTRLGLDGGLDEWLRRGYATASTDTGHRSTDDNWAVGHPERVIDYAYRSKHLVTVAAKGLIAAYYGRPATHAYFNSCSNGGRQGLMEVQRYPRDYDGVVVGAPWNYQSRSNAGFVWDAQTLSASGAAIASSKLPAIQAAAVAACDATDGLVDGLIEQPDKCSFAPEVLQCTTADSDDCLTEAQIASLGRLYSGPENPRTGAAIFPGWAVGSERGWARWVDAEGVTNLGHSYFSNLVFEDPNWDYRTFDFEKDLTFAESKVGSLADAIDTDLSAAKRQGVKIIQYHGWNDQTLQPGYSPSYYDLVTSEMGGLAETQDFYRLFMVPGMAHCYRGPGANSFGGVGQQIPPQRDALHDVQLALEEWVEKGVAPDRLVATKYVDDDADTTTVEFTRTLCPYPSVARYSQSGDPSEAGSFVCTVP